MSKQSPTLDEMIAAAAAAQGPAAIPRLDENFSSIDPCGLREINFEMMDLVADGLNNVARHIRPFTLVSWAWRRAYAVAGETTIDHHLLPQIEDFVSRIETIFAWSNFLADPHAPLPGSSALQRIIARAEFTFGGAEWAAFDKVRRNSTALSAAINYGPGLKSLGWLKRHSVNSRVLVPSEEATAALDAFEERIRDRLDHPAFTAFGSVSVTRDEAMAWADGWSIDSLTDEERAFAARSLYGDLASPSRAKGIGYLLQAAEALGDMEPGQVRKAVAGEIEGFGPDGETEGTAALWKALQVRQLFRLSVEALLAWIIDRLSDGPAETQSLASKFMDEAGIDPASSGDAALLSLMQADEPVTRAMDDISAALARPLRDGLALAISCGLSLSLANAPEEPKSYGKDNDRLPLAKAASQARARSGKPAGNLVKHAIETWALAQHVAWAVRRGLADARRGGNTIIRLKTVVDEGGWGVLPGTGRLNPNPTPDRIQTALMLAAECAAA